MAKDLDSEIKQFNQMALERELTSALIIKHQLQHMLTDFEHHFPGEQSAKIKEEIMNSADDSIKGMLHAENKESFVLQEKRLNHLVEQLKEKFGLKEKKSEAALSSYRLLYVVLRGLKETNYERKDQLSTIWSDCDWCKEHPEYPSWVEQLNDLQRQNNEHDFEQRKSELLAKILNDISERKLDSLSALALVEQNMQLLSETRLSYLKESQSRSKLMKSMGWVGLGVLLVAGATVAALAFPVVAIPGIILGGAVVGYGAIDFAKKSANFYTKASTVPIGSREEDAQTRAHLQGLADQLGVDLPKFIEKQQVREEKKSNEKKWVKRLGMAASFTGLALGIAALAAALPFIGMPLAAVVVIAVISLAVAALTTTLLAYRARKKQTEWKREKQEVEQQITEDNKLMDEVSLREQARERLDSTAKIIMDEEKVSERLHESIKLEPKPTPTLVSSPAPTPASADVTMTPMPASNTVVEEERKIASLYLKEKSLFAKKEKEDTDHDKLAEDQEGSDEDEMNERL
ncbi:hypothetical protein [Legionella oakridgensis]|uniref:IncA protein n=1 Tax=Legionella oakridgensis TaxID=29423 RepID=A0A0W0X0H4_9GAMM|nr:hypothetical protein [Legionella oakridgensis]KTD38004.1 hypothetical protein Loak_1680 [Legionella oakridgensis]STY20274.1 Uncharacterised protein [Legionella longbeachae]